VCSTLFSVKGVQEFHYVTQQKSVGSFPDKPKLVTQKLRAVLHVSNSDLYSPYQLCDFRR